MVNMYREKEVTTNKNSCKNVVHLLYSMFWRSCLFLYLRVNRQRVHHFTVFQPFDTILTFTCLMLWSDLWAHVSIFVYHLIIIKQFFWTRKVNVLTENISPCDMRMKEMKQNNKNAFSYIVSFSFVFFIEHG